MNNPITQMYKIVLIGDSGVGKTNIISQFIEEKYKPNTQTTINLDFSVKTIQLDDTVIHSQFWDTAGQEQFRSINKSYYRGSDAIIIVFDITRKQTFDNILSWLKEITYNIDTNLSDLELLIIGNKTDLSDQRQISHDDVDKLLNNYQFIYIETSAKNNIGITDGLTQMIQRMHTRKPKPKQITALNINDESDVTIYTNKSKCCSIL